MVNGFDHAIGVLIYGSLRWSLALSMSSGCWGLEVSGCHEMAGVPEFVLMFLVATRWPALGLGCF